MALLEVRGLVRRFGGLIVLDRVDLTLDAGSITALIGPNGAGKSTLLRILAGVDDATAVERLAFDGRDLRRTSVHRRRRDGIGFVGQTPRTFASMPVVGDVALGVGGRVPWPICLERARDVLTRIDEDDLADRHNQHISVRDRRKVELARTLVAAPRLLMLDEPMAGLTVTEIGELSLVIDRYRADTGATVLWVEHRMPAVRALADRVVVIDQGRIIADGPPAEALADPRVVETYLGRAGT